MSLSNVKIKNAAPRDRSWKLSDEKGLYLLITPAGSKLWQFKFRHLGKERKLSLGAFPEVSLKNAREKRDEARAMLASGRDPSHERQMAKLEARFAANNTFAAVAREFIAKRERDGIADATKDKADWLLSLLLPGLGKVSVGEITAPMLLSVLQDIELSGRRETARRLRNFAGRILNYAIATGRRTEANPAPALHRALATPVVRSHPAIVDPRKLGALLRSIDQYGGYPSTVAALQITPHLFQRPGEIRTMRWDELDLGNGRWTIPAEKMKMRKPHEVPLSRQVRQILGSLADLSRDSEFVFPAYHNTRIPISENAINQALRRLGYGGIMTAHGFRSTASSLLNESGEWNPDAIERALAHQDGNAIRGTYNRSRYWPQRVSMMQWWSDYLDALKLESGSTGSDAGGPKRAPRKAPIGA